MFHSRLAPRVLIAAGALYLLHAASGAGKATTVFADEPLVRSAGTDGPRLQRIDVGTYGAPQAAPFDSDMMVAPSALTSFAPSGLPVLAGLPIGGGTSDSIIDLDVERMRPHAIIDTDDRVEAPVGYYPFSAVGRIEGHLGDQGWSCTGTLVARNIVLTNRHCVYDHDLNRLADAATFTPGYRNGVAPYGVANATYAYLSDDTTFTGMPLDFALLIIDEDLGNRAGWIAVRSFDTRWVPSPAWWTMAGYGFNWYGNLGQTTIQTYNSAPCRTLDLTDSNRIVTHDCDSGGGNSGSAIYAWFDDGTGRAMPYVVAVNFAEWRAGSPFASCGGYRFGWCANLAVQSQQFIEPLRTLINRQW